MSKHPVGKSNTLIGIVGLVLSAVSFVGSLLNGSFSSPYYVVVIVLVGIVGAYAFGYCSRDIAEALSAWIEDRMEAAASKAVERKMIAIDNAVDTKLAVSVEAAVQQRMADIEAITDGRIDSLFGFDPATGTLSINAPIEVNQSCEDD